LSKGRLVLVEGSLQTRKWQDQQGQNRYTTEIKAQRVVFMDSQGQSTASAPGHGSTSGSGQDEDPFDMQQGGSENLGPAFPSEASAMDDAPF